MRNLKKLILITSAGALMAVAALTGCKSESQSSGDRSTGRAIDDETITEHVQERLKTEPVYKFSDISVKTFDGIVQLSGFASNEDEKRRAGQLAQTVDGVVRVVNNITLKPDALTPTGTGGKNY